MRQRVKKLCDNDRTSKRQSEREREKKSGGEVIEK